MPEFIHERAKEIMKSTKDQYGPEKGKQIAFALATQQSHAIGKSPKTWHGKPFGTPEGRREAKEKYDEPSKMQKAAGPDDPSLWAYIQHLLGGATPKQGVPGKWPPLPIELPKVQPTDAKMSFTDPEFINTWKGAEGLAEWEKDLGKKEAELRLQTWATLDALRDIMGARG